MRVHSTALAECAGIAHGFFTRQGGVSEGIYATLNGGPGSQDDPAHIGENQRRILSALGHAPRSHLPPHEDEHPILCTLDQVHSADVLTLRTVPARRPTADALVTATPGLALAVSTADCGPVLLADPSARIIAAAHAGWKGALGGIVEHTVEAMVALGADRSRIIAAIGPCIAQGSYEVGQEFYQRFVAHRALYGRFFRPAHPDRQATCFFDLPGFIAHRLAQCGLQRIDSLAMDTYSDETRFFSYRRATHRGEPDYGRQLSVIMIRNDE